MSIYDIKVKDANGNDISLSEYKGKVLLIVNTATGCGFTPQYDGLQDLYEKYQEKGFEILDFPCNQFGSQAPGTQEEIASFCSSRFGITFRQFAKTDVNGKNQSPLYKFLKEQKGGVLGDNIKWNFTKFLVDRNGNVVDRFAPTVTPEKIDKYVEEVL
ncbi:MAG: glutathione peroxidase [Ruminococcus sp.]|nr:glutathione peroxidase [Ruminococcus sp.]